ncbi:hypothetical protein [Bacteroides sp. 51]|uniref:hypothetical protein n=1 Tax=Bacteroides sp. 51 TaxID=2302938 RepID=UPI0013D77BC2|nr:hypothetical protein [Bacteroides sp. 51]NDV81342.1 hypothetical protein [Bacteroides sp. 51]
MSSLSFHDKQHVLRLLQQQGQVKRIFDDFTRRSGLILTKWTEKSPDNVWVRNSTLEKQIDTLLQELHDNLLANIDAHTIDAWEAANIKSDDLIKSYIKDLSISEIVGKSRYEELEKGMFARNMEALKGFQQRKINGFTVSDTVWKSVQGAKENLEYYLSSGISTGRPAASIAVDIRQLLEGPEKRFRRIRNEEGKLVLSQPMKDYHPGQGRYRSSYMNALRIAVTETNMAYHTADHERWKNQGFVLGIEVHRSKSNKGPCSICDPMVGRYPKDFKFTTWHPFCICFAVPVMLEGEEFIDYLLTSEVPEDKLIKTVPQSAIDYINAKEANQKQWFVKENAKYLLIPNSGQSKDYVLNVNKLKDRGFYVSGVDTKGYKKLMGNFNIEELDRDIMKLTSQYNIQVETKELSSYFGETKLEYVGKDNFRLTRSFFDNVVYHDTFTLPTDKQGKGFAKELFRSLYTQYKNAGISEIQIVANMDIGGYAWAKYGFKAKADRYDDLMSWARFQRDESMISKNDFSNFQEWIKSYEGKDIPMYEIAGRKYGKKLLQGSVWKGYINLNDKEQMTVFEAYLSKSK